LDKEWERQVLVRLKGENEKKCVMSKKNENIKQSNQIPPLMCFTLGQEGIMVVQATMGREQL